MRAMVYDLRHPGQSWGSQTLGDPIKDDNALFSHILRTSTDGELSRIYAVEIFPGRPEREVVFLQIEGWELRKCECGNAYLDVQWRELT